MTATRTQQRWFGRTLAALLWAGVGASAAEPFAYITNQGDHTVSVLDLGLALSLDYGAVTSDGRPDQAEADGHPRLVQPALRRLTRVIPHNATTRSEPCQYP
jgi:DNA-binding beta-propeller fold protein YncE